MRFYFRDDHRSMIKKIIRRVEEITKYRRTPTNALSVSRQFEVALYHVIL